MRSVWRYGLFYFLVGPIIGTLVMHSMVIYANVMDSNGLGLSLNDVFVSLPVLIPISLLLGYLLGGLQAAFVGILTGMVKDRKGSESVLVPLFWAIISWMVFSLVIVLVDPQSTNSAETVFSSNNGLLWLMLHVVSAFGAWCAMKLWTKSGRT